MTELALTLLRPSQLHADGPNRDPSTVPRDRYDRPLIHVPGAAKLVPYTRCTTYVDCIEDKSSLATWGKRMIVAGATRAPQILAQAGGLDPHEQANKRTIDRIARRLEDAAGAHAKREKGTHLHALSEYVDRGDPLPPCTAADLADMTAYKSATVTLDVVHIERLVVVDHLKIAGTPDRISHYDGPGPDGSPLVANLITDLKTGSVTYGALKMAMQLAVYSRGTFYDHTTRSRTPLPDVHQDWGLIIHLPAGEAQCTVYWVDLAAGWDAVQVATRVRALRSKRRLLTPLRSTHPRPASQPEVVALDTQA